MKKRSRAAFILALSLAAHATAQQPAATRTTQQPPPTAPPQQQAQPAPVAVDDEEVVRITTNLVQLDLVVTDKSGRQVTDLKAEDFDILQDNRPQQITNFSYVSTVPGSLASSTSVARGPVNKNEPPPPPRPARRERARRTMVIVVDDLGMSFPSVASARAALTKIIDEQLQPDDLVAIVRTGADAGMLQQLTSDHRLLHAAVEHIHWNYLSRQGLYNVSPVRQDDRSGLNAGSGPLTNVDLPPGCKTAETLSESLLKLRFIIEGMRELPGRKSVVLFSDKVPLLLEESTACARVNFNDLYRDIAEQAIRTSVVIYAIDTRGLQTLTPSAVDNLSGLSREQLDTVTNARADESISGSEGSAFLAARTGGFVVRHANDVTGWLRRIVDDQRGYYLIGYRPEGTTFDRRFHKITARVKNRPDLTVRTRSGFYGLTEEESRPAAPTNADRLARALVSPFASGALGLRLTPVFAYSPATGAVLRTLLHIDAHNLTFKDQPDGWKAADLVLRGTLFGDNGQVVEEHDRSYTVRLRGKTYERALAHGFNYTFDMPVNKTGYYQYRVALLDPNSSRVGSAGQPVEIPDLRKGFIALSGILMKGVVDASQPKQTATEAAQPKEGPDDAEDADPTPFVRRFRQTTTIDYNYLIFNARIDKQTGATRLVARAQLFREGQLVYKDDESPVEVRQYAGATRVLNGGRLLLDDRFPPGDYALQIIITDPLADKDHRTATQWIDFEVVK
ncbi:MAG: hypothetical protein QOE33_1758 [Acidobacteriota bacterium]|nr:hypothetical protein [Acidobacteriota bacterium]